MIKIKLKEYEEKAAGRKCVMCQEPLPGEIENYEHSEGWEVEGFEKRQWLYITCPECGYENALQKLGIPRELS